MQWNTVANVTSSPTSTDHDDNKAAPKWMHQQMKMMFIFGQAAVALHDTLVVRVSVVFECDE